MKSAIKSDKEEQITPKTGRYATPEEAALAKNANLLAHIKELGITVEKLKADQKSKPSS